MSKESSEINKQRKFMRWIQEFSKKIVVVFFITYLIILAILVLVIVKIGGSAGIDTMTTEINETFRVVIGGYIIKAAVENAIKIGSQAVLDKIDAKSKVKKAEAAVAKTAEEVNKELAKQGLSVNDITDDEAGSDSNNGSDES
jgi:ActR/RegA family two-component response regulator